MEVNYVRPTLEEALLIAQDMREDDRREVLRLGSTPEKAIIEGFANADDIWLVYFDNKPGCIIGISCHCILGNIGSPWFLTTNVMNDFAAKREMVKMSPVFVNMFHDTYDMLVNYVDAEYAKSLRWLKWLGFEIGDPERLNEKFKQRFCKITRRKDNGR